MYIFNKYYSMRSTTIIKFYRRMRLLSADADDGDDDDDDYSLAMEVLLVAVGREGMYVVY